MKNHLKMLGAIPALLLATLVFTGCSKDDNNPGPNVPDEPAPTGKSKTYELISVSDPAITGTAKFIEIDDNSVTVELQLENTPDGGQHPAHIHLNTAVEGGGISITLATIDGDTGTSTINFSKTDDGTDISYDELLEFDGYINVHLSSGELGTLIAQGDIGQNELTGTSKSYTLGSVSNPDIDGTATFSERVNGEALATIALNNTTAGNEHPGHIHLNTAAEGGDIAFTFNPVNGETGTSITNVATLDDGSAFGYSDVLDFDGYINIHLSDSDLGTLIAQGDIGENELTGTTKEYTLNSISDPAIEGTATFSERINGEALAVLALTNTIPGSSHPSHIHVNSAAVGGDIIFTFNPVSGDTGTSITNVAALDDSTPLGYEQILVIDGHINVHLSEADLGTLIAQGNIGINENDEPPAGKNYDVTSNGVISYVFNSDDLSDAENPDLTLQRGATYTFTVNASGHPFFIKSVQGDTNANAYNNGVTNNGAEMGTITFDVPMDAPDILYYNCEFHSIMTGILNIID